MDDNKAAKAPIYWVNYLFLTISPVVAVVLVVLYTMYYGAFNVTEWVAFVVLMLITGTAITAGYHRLWSHKTYKAHFLLRAWHAFWGACAIQNSVFHWASDHRRHHLFVDDWDKDPYSAKRGFFFSHMGWIMRNYQSSEDDFSNIKDLLKDPILQFQNKYYLPLALFSNLAVPAALGYLLCDGNPWGMVVLCGFVRLVVNHHFTFSINSLAHIWGSQPYNNKDTARDNGILSLFTYGEGYHNFHHKFQNDYRNGVNWWAYDISKWMIFVLSKVGLASGLKRTPKQQIEMAIAVTQYEAALAKLDDKKHGFEEVTDQLKEKYAEYITVLEEFYNSKKEWVLAKTDDCITAAETSDLHQRYLELKENFKLERMNWNKLVVAH